jgi:hypothetical protein
LRLTPRAEMNQEFIYSTKLLFTPTLWFKGVLTKGLVK